MSMANELKAGMVQGVSRWTQITLGVAVTNAPVDTGTLRRSAVAVVSESGDTAEASLSFNTVYAAVQHEGEDFNHPNGGGAKYLERAVKDNSHQIIKQLEMQRDRVLASWVW